jgi:hypothetical protein
VEAQSLAEGALVDAQDARRIGVDGDELGRSVRLEGFFDPMARDLLGQCDVGEWFVTGTLEEMTPETLGGSALACDRRVVLAKGLVAVVAAEAPL